MPHLEAIIESFIDVEADLIALEAEIDDNQTSTSEFNQIVSDRVDKITKRAIKKVDEELTKLEARKKVLLSQAKAFDTEFNGLRTNYEPEKSIEILNYEYDENVLDNYETSAKALFVDGFNKFAGFINNPDRINSKNNILGADSRRVTAGILDKFKAPADVTTADGIYAEVKKEFRGKKRTQKLGNGTITRYNAASKNVTNIVNNASLALKDIKAKLSNISRILESFIRSTSNTQDNKRKMPKLVRNFVTLTNFYIGMIMYCFELRVEKVVNSRIIIKKFYKKENSKEVAKDKRIEEEGEENAQG